VKLRDRFQQNSDPFLTEKEARVMVEAVTEWLHDKVIRHPRMTISELLSALHAEEL
jgi:hypothetical protein